MSERNAGDDNLYLTDLLPFGLSEIFPKIIKKLLKIRIHLFASFFVPNFSTRCYRAALPLLHQGGQSRMEVNLKNAFSNFFTISYGIFKLFRYFSKNYGTLKY